MLRILGVVIASALLGFSGQRAVADSAVFKDLDATLASAWTVDDLGERMALAVNILGDPWPERAEGWLPVGTRVDGIACDDGLCDLELTFPASTPDAIFEDGDADSVNSLLARLVVAGADFRGLRIHARIGDAGEYRPLDDFVFASGPGAYPPLREDAGIPQVAAVEAGVSDSDARGDLRTGPVANAGHQPSGALSGVTVFAAAGHGWTAGTSSWFLQRGLLLNMVEDYGNLEQLNYFVNYLYNAGATVVPFRPVGYQANEVVLDQDDPGVIYTGSWTNSGSSPYYENGVTNSGVHYRFTSTNAGSETAKVRYTPNLPTTGSYPVYTWVLDSSNRTTQLYRIAHSGGVTEVVVDHRMVGRGWVWLGSYYFDAGTAGYVEISNQSSVNGSVIADAIRFGNGTGDVVGAGPGTVSGYPRDEEAQRYWAESETSINASGLPSSIYDCCSSDSSDNVGTGGTLGAGDEQHQRRQQPLPAYLPRIPLQCRGL
jgi:hypothetical protein